MDICFLPSSLVPELVMPAFGQGKFVRVYGRQGKFDKRTRNTSMVLANKKRPRLQIKVFKTTFRAHKQRNLSREICQGKPVDCTHEKVNLSRKLVKEHLIVCTCLSTVSALSNVGCSNKQLSGYNSVSSKMFEEFYETLQVRSSHPGSPL